MRQLLGVGIASLFAGGLIWALTSGGASPNQSDFGAVAAVAKRDRSKSLLVEQEEGYLALLAPQAQFGKDERMVAALPVPEEGQLHAMAYQYDSPIYPEPGSSRITGIARRGAQLLVGEKVSGPGCRRGDWYRVVGGPGVLCSSTGFTVTEEPQSFYIRQVPPRSSSPMPFDYGKVTTKEALRYFSLPSPSEQAEAESARRRGASYPKVVERRLNGDYLVALDRLEGSKGRRFWRTIRGRYVPEEQVISKPMPLMVGEHLKGGLKLPLAFVFGDETVPLLAYRDGRLEEVGVAEKHARFEVAKEARWANVPVVVSTRGFAVPRARVRLVRSIRPPAGIPKGARFLHVDLTEQALVAYEGSKPVFATLISSGKEGYDTPTGLHRVAEKHLSTTMRGNDPREGIYEVEEVPWTLFYHNSYAVHGAYWHNDFGTVRSHGCTNLAPADAKFVYNWTSPEVPMGWNGMRDAEGTYVYLTRDKDT